MNSTFANDINVDWFTYAALSLLEKQGNNFPSQQDIETTIKQLVDHLVKQVRAGNCPTGGSG